MLAEEAAAKADIDIIVRGGGIPSQAEAVRIAIARGLVKLTKDAALVLFPRVADYLAAREATHRNHHFYLRLTLILPRFKLKLARTAYLLERCLCLRAPFLLRDGLCTSVRRKS